MSIQKKSCECIVCQHLSNGKITTIKTTKLCILILQSLMQKNPYQEYFSLKEDVNNFISSHWNILINFKQFQQKNWRKSILDAFNHCTKIESGKEIEKRGIYKLKDLESVKSMKLTNSNNSNNSNDLNTLKTMKNGKNFKKSNSNENENEIINLNQFQFNQNILIQNDLFEKSFGLMTIQKELEIQLQVLQEQINQNQMYLQAFLLQNQNSIQSQIIPFSSM